MFSLNARKKKIIVIFIALFVIGICSAVILFLVEKENNAKPEIPKYSFEFHVADFKRDIFEDSEYLELNRYIAYKEGANSTLITDEDYALYGPVVEFFAGFIDSIIRGDNERYNTFFSREYLDANGEKGVFTMQQLYNIELEYFGIRDVEIDGMKYSVHEVSLEYMIRQNNGSFRNDMGSDATKEQIFYVAERGGSLEIMADTTFNYAY